MVLDLLTTLDDLGSHLYVSVTPQASSNRIKLDHLPDGTHLFRIHVTTIATDGKANAAMLKILANALKISPSCLAIVKGHKSRHKIIKIANLTLPKSK